MNPFLLVLLLPMAAVAQVRSWGAFTGEFLEGDTHIVLSTISSNPTRVRGWKLAEGNTIHRVFFDERNEPAFGYDLKITPDSKAKTFQVSVLRPRSTFRMRYPPLKPGLAMEDRLIDGRKLASFPKLPAPVTIADGDRVDVPVFEKSATGDRVLDSYSVAFRGTAATVVPRPGNDFPKYLPKETLLTLQRPQLSDVGENLFMGVSGPVVWFYSRWLGRTLFSASPRPGFLRQATVEGAAIRFYQDVEQYRLDLAAPVVSSPGSFWLWVKREPHYKPPPGPWTADELHKGMLALGIER
jgi:hypothetical protein